MRCLLQLQLHISVCSNSSEPAVYMELSLVETEQKLKLAEATSRKIMREENYFATLL